MLESKHNIFSIAKDNAPVEGCTVSEKVLQGGACSMKAWSEQGLAAKDGVHFSKLGYQQAADVLAFGDACFLQQIQAAAARADKHKIGGVLLQYAVF